MQMNTVELNIDKYESMLKELGVLKTENEELKKRLQTSHNNARDEICPKCGSSTWRTDGQHSNEFCAKCFTTKPGKLSPVA